MNLHCTHSLQLCDAVCELFIVSGCFVVHGKLFSVTSELLWAGASNIRVSLPHLQKTVWTLQGVYDLFLHLWPPRGQHTGEWAWTFTYTIHIVLLWCVKFNLAFSLSRCSDKIWAESVLIPTIRIDVVLLRSSHCLSHSSVSAFKTCDYMIITNN